MNSNDTATLGDVVVAVFDEAALHAASPEVISRLATRTVQALVRRTLPTARWSRTWEPAARPDHPELATRENQGGAATANGARMLARARSREDVL